MESVYNDFLWVFLLTVQGLYDYIRNWNILGNTSFTKLTLSCLVRPLQTPTMGLWEEGVKRLSAFSGRSLTSWRVSLLPGRSVCWKQGWLGGWGMYMYHSPQFKRMCIHSFIISDFMSGHEVLLWVVSVDPLPSGISGSSLFFGTEFGEAGGICGLSSKCIWCWPFPTCTQQQGVTWASQQALPEET